MENYTKNIHRTTKPNNNNHPSIYSFLSDIEATPQELLFAQELAQTPNDEKGALKRSGNLPTPSPDGKNKSPKETIDEFKKSKAFQHAYQNALVDKVDRLKITEDKTLAHLHKIAFRDVSQMYNDDNGTMKSVQDMPWEVRCCISKIKHKERWAKDKETGKICFDGQDIEVEMYSAMDALKTLIDFMSKVPQMQQSGGTFIQQNNYYNNEQNNLNINLDSLQNLDKKEIDTFLDLLGHDVTDDVLQLENMTDPEESVQVV